MTSDPSGPAEQAAAGPAPAAAVPAGVWRLGSFQGVPIYISPTLLIAGGLFALAFLPTLERADPEMGPRKYLVAALFAVLLYASILVHEIAHAATALRYGLKVRSVTLHLLGGVTAMDDRYPQPGRQFVIAAAGPAATLALAGLGLLGLQVTPVGNLVHTVLLNLTLANLVVGVYNLLPGLPLDGGAMVAAGVWKVSGSERTGTVVAAWIGRGVAVLTALLPLLVADGRPDLVLQLWALLIAFFLWTGSSQALRFADVRDRLGALSVLGLVRPAVGVPGDVSVAEVTRRAEEAGVGAVVVVDSAGRPVALVNEAAVRAVPGERRPWVTANEVSRRIDPGMVLRADLGGEALVEAIQRTPATEYLVVDEEGRVRGVLATSDVEQAVR